MGAFVGRTAVKDGKGVMVDWHYADGKDYLPSDDVRPEAPPGPTRIRRRLPAHTRRGRRACRSRRLRLQLLNGLAGVVAVPGRRGPDADLRRHARRQFRARLALHAGRLRRVVGGRALSRCCRALRRILDGGARRGTRRRAHRRADRDAAAEAPVCGARAAAAHGDLRHRADRPRRGARDLGPRGPPRPARRRARRRGRRSSAAPSRPTISS